jgi:hypothetical protein
MILSPPQARGSRLHILIQTSMNPNPVRTIRSMSHEPLRPIIANRIRKLRTIEIESRSLYQVSTYFPISRPKINTINKEIL